MKQWEFFAVSAHLSCVDSEIFRDALEAGLQYSRGRARRQRLGAGEKQALQGSSEAQDIWPDACRYSHLIAQYHD